MQKIRYSIIYFKKSKKILLSVFSDMAHRQIAEFNIFYGGSEESFAFVIYCHYHLSDLSVLSLGQGHFEPRMWVPRV